MYLIPSLIILMLFSQRSSLIHFFICLFNLFFAIFRLIYFLVTPFLIHLHHFMFSPFSISNPSVHYRCSYATYHFTPSFLCAFFIFAIPFIPSVYFLVLALLRSSICMLFRSNFLFVIYMFFL